MDFLFALAIVVGFVYLIGRVHKLTEKTIELESALRNLRQLVMSDQDLSFDSSPDDKAYRSVSTPVRPEPSFQPVDDTPIDIPEPVQPSSATVMVPKPAYQRVAKAGKLIGAVDPDLSDRVIVWLRENWFYALSVICLSLAGIFLIHYGVERGLLTPPMRVVFALLLGFLLIGAGEFFRRRTGDDAASHTAYLPSTLSGAGIIVQFVAILGARHLYGLVGAETTFVALAGLSVSTVVLGWIYGPVLTVIGLLGATLVPFIVGGSSETTQQFFYYFALIAITGLLVDMVKRWLWPSLLALAFTYAGAGLLFFAKGDDIHFLAFAVLTTIAAIIIPNRKIRPDHAGAMLIEAIAPDAQQMPQPPTLVAGCAIIAGFLTAFAVAYFDHGLTELITALAVIGGLQMVCVVWLRHARALTDVNLIAPIGFFAILVVQSISGGSLYQYVAASLPVAAPLTVSADALTVILGLVGFGALGSILAFFRALNRSEFDLFWGLGLAFYAPLTIILLEVFWQPQTVLGAEGWGAVGLAMAALMTLFAERLARIDGTSKIRVSLAVLAALTMLSFALVVTLTAVALTVALAVMVLVAVLIDRRFDLRPLSIFVQVGVVLVSGRLIVWPGVVWAVDAPLIELLGVYGAAIGTLLLAWHYIRGRERIAARIVTESAVLSLPFVLVIILLYRALELDVQSHWGQSLIAMTCLISAAVQYYRLQVSTGLVRGVRIGLGGLFGILSALTFSAALFAFNPLLNESEIVRGPYLADTLFIAYGLPALLFGGLLLLFGRGASAIKPALIWLIAGFGGLYVVLETRRLWRGDVLSVPGTTNPELYTYTVLMILTSAILLLLAFFRRSSALYKIAVIGVGLTLAKAFLVDMAGLDGLLRVISFLGLGLVLAALAWLNTQVKRRIDPPIA